MADTEQEGAPSATAGGAPGPDVAAPIEEVPPYPAYVENAVAGALTDMYGFLPLSVRYGAAAAARAFVESWTRSRPVPAVEILSSPTSPNRDWRDAEIKQLRTALARYQKRLGDDLLSGGKLVERARAALRVDNGSTCTRASMDGVVGDVGRLCDETERLRGELDKANTGWEVWRDEQRARDKRRDNELRVVAERLHELIGDTEPCAMAFISTRHLHGLLDRVVAEPSPEIERLKLEVASARSIADEKRAVAEKLRGQVDDLSNERDDLAERLEAVRPAREAFRKQLNETDRLRDELHRIRDIALVVLNVLPDDDDRSAVDLVREILLRRDNQFRDLVAERDRKRRELADVTAERDDYAGRLRNTDAAYAEVTAERDRLRQDLDFIAGQQPKFRDGQRVRIGRHFGTVEKPKDVTRVRLDGMAPAALFETRLVNAIEDAPAEPRRWTVGDSEPEPGVTVTTSGRSNGLRWTLRRNGTWHMNNCPIEPEECPTPGTTWGALLGKHRQLVEVVDSDG